MNFPALLYGSDFWSALAGAVVGGGIGIIGQILTINANSNSIKERINEERKAAIISVIPKIIQIHTNNFSIIRVFEDSKSTATSIVERLEDKSEKIQPWQFYQPMANIPNLVYFSDSEKSSILWEAPDKLFNELIQVEISHNSLMSAMAELNLQSNRLRSIFSVSGIQNGNIVEAKITREEFEESMRLQISVNGLCRDALQFALANAQETNEFSKNYLRFMSEKYNFNKDLHFKEAPSVSLDI